jgi:hypothetical protein
VKILFLAVLKNYRIAKVFTAVTEFFESVYLRFVDFAECNPVSTDRAAKNFSTPVEIAGGIKCITGFIMVKSRPGTDRCLFRQIVEYRRRVLNPVLQIGG